MKINVIGQQTNNINKIQAYNGVVSYYWENEVIPILRRYHDVMFYDAKEVDDMRICDRTFLICPYAIVKSRLDLEPNDKCGLVHRLHDAWVCLAPVHNKVSKPNKTYNVTYGADPTILYPSQNPYPTILLQEFILNKDSNNNRVVALEVIEMLKKEFRDIFVYSTCVNDSIIDECIFEDQNGYMKWTQFCKYYRESWATIDLTPFDIELSKLDSVACGCYNFMPLIGNTVRPHSRTEINILQQYKYDTAEELYNQLKKLINIWTPNLAYSLHKEVTGYFTWARVAYKVLKFLED